MIHRSTHVIGGISIAATVILILMLALVAAAADPKPPEPSTCTWGASSTIVENGVQQPPATSGCIPS